MLKHDFDIKNMESYGKAFLIESKLDHNPLFLYTFIFSFNVIYLLETLVSYLKIFSTCCDKKRDLKSSESSQIVFE